MLILAGAGLTARAGAQALPTASANLRLSAFAGLSGTYTGLELAKNGDVTAGADIGFRPFAGFFPSLEGRGAYPIDGGRTVSLENALGGIRLGRNKDNFYPYGDFLFGRGKLTFPGGYPNPSGTFRVLSNTSNVYSFGGGLDYVLTRHFAAKGDFQMQKYGTPVTASGALYAKVFTAGIVFRFGMGSVR